MSDQPTREPTEADGSRNDRTSGAQPDPDAAPAGFALVVVGAVAAGSFFWSASAAFDLFSRSRSAWGYVADSIRLGIGLAVLSSAWLAWRMGGYRALVSDAHRERSRIVQRKVIGFVHELAENIVRASAYAAGVTVLLAVSPDASLEARQICAGITIVLFVGGLVVRAATNSNRTALSARATNLRNTLNQLSRSTERVRQGLANAAFELEDIEKHIGSQLRHLSEDQEAIDRLSVFLRGDPKAVASMDRQRRKEGRRAIGHAWLGVLVGVIVSLLLTAYPPIGKWIEAHLHL